MNRNEGDNKKDASAGDEPDRFEMFEDLTIELNDSDEAEKTDLKKAAPTAEKDEVKPDLEANSDLDSEKELDDDDDLDIPEVLVGNLVKQFLFQGSTTGNDFGKDANCSVEDAHMIIDFNEIRLSIAQD